MFRTRLLSSDPYQFVADWSVGQLLTKRLFTFDSKKDQNVFFVFLQKSTERIHFKKCNSALSCSRNRVTISYLNKILAENPCYLSVFFTEYETNNVLFLITIINFDVFENVTNLNIYDWLFIKWSQSLNGLISGHFWPWFKWNHEKNIQSHQTFVKWYSKPTFDARFRCHHWIITKKVISVVLCLFKSCYSRCKKAHCSVQICINSSKDCKVIEILTEWWVGYFFSFFLFKRVRFFCILIPVYQSLMKKEQQQVSKDSLHCWNCNPSLSCPHHWPY